MVVPDRESPGVFFQVSQKPFSHLKKLLAPISVSCAAKEIVISQSVLSDCDRVVLHSNFAVIIEQWNSCGIVWPHIIGLTGKRHVIFAQFAEWRIQVLFRGFVPEGEMAVTTEQIRTDDS